ncbi:hypothetical protein LUZ60_004721 [Juncus effusus]|nr:hypothetical protein LUZ60_004721 [Juncus effusus]
MSEASGTIMVVFSVLMLQILLIVPFTTADQPIIAKPGCNETCGDVSIPYPFGIGSNCSAKSFEINCTVTTGTYMPLIFGVKVLDISLSLGEIRVNNPISSQCYDSQNKTDNTIEWEWNLNPSFQFNHERNKFTVIGCNTLAFVKLHSQEKGYLGGCVSGCDSLDSLVDGSCSGIGCCQTAIPKGTDHYEVYFDEDYNNSLISSFSDCGYAVLMEYVDFNFSSRYITTDELYKKGGMPVVLDWSISYQTCQQAQLNKSSYACLSSHSICVDSRDGLQGYLCNCSAGYQGNPYLVGGCQGVSLSLPISGSTGCEPDQELALWVKLLIGIPLGFMVILLCLFVIYMANQRRKLARMKEEYFQQYGGMLLLDEMRKRHGHKFKLFPEKELKEATNSFDETTVLGRGGNGTVYKGTLGNNEVVAIKRCKTIDERQKKEFGKEILILSQINHKNIVRILGCCLEVEIPILVYEFIPNGTLFDLIHEKRSLHISLSTRLRIAVEAAVSLAYLHSDANPPIVHRDVKSSNILLDVNFMAKVSDFGASILAPTDQDPFATLVQGTRGYLDPEYVQSGQLTFKSDVYSFGVVLLELLTRRKPLYFDGPEEDRCLTSRFLSVMKENKLDEILDDEIVKEENLELIKEVAKLAKKCLLMEGEKRPEMKQVAEELDKLRKTMKHPSQSENFDERESLLRRGESSKSHEIEMSGYYSLEKKAMLEYGR